MSDWLRFPDQLGLFEVVVGLLLLIGLPIAYVLIWG